MVPPNPEYQKNTDRKDRTIKTEKKKVPLRILKRELKLKLGIRQPGFVSSSVAIKLRRTFEKNINKALK